MRKCRSAEEIIHKLPEAEMSLGQGRTVKEAARRLAIAGQSSIVSATVRRESRGTRPRRSLICSSINKTRASFDGRWPPFRVRGKETLHEKQRLSTFRAECSLD
jgi:hypothetical protein